MKIPEGATHQDGPRFYKKAGPSAYWWCPARGAWRYMEDGDARRALRKAAPLAGA